MNVVTLYTKPGCGLCDEAKEQIELVRREISFELKSCNILDDLADYERYKHDIPVILLNGREIARHHLSPDQLRIALQSRGSE